MAAPARAFPLLRAGGEEAGRFFAGAGLAFFAGAGLAFFAGAGLAFFAGAGLAFTGAGLTFFATGRAFVLGGLVFVEADAFVVPPAGAAARDARDAAAELFCEGRGDRLAEVEPAEGGAIFVAVADFARTDF